MASNTQYKVKANGEIIAQFMFVSHALHYMNTMRDLGVNDEYTLNYANRKNVFTLAPYAKSEVQADFDEIQITVIKFQDDSMARLDAQLAKLWARANASIEANKVGA